MYAQSYGGPHSYWNEILSYAIEGYEIHFEWADYHYVGQAVKSQVSSLNRGMGLFTFPSCAQSNGGIRLYWNEILRYIIGVDEI